eukprot:g1802.t1
MLSAEHYALESAAVQQLLRIREAEVNYYKDRFESVTIQSALIAGLTIQTLTSVDVVDHHHTAVRAVFWLAGASGFGCSMFTMVMATFAMVWVTLRGPKGSVTKAYYIMKRENAIVMKAYLLQFFFFVIMAATTFEIKDYSSNYNWPALTAGGIVASAGIFTFYKLFEMKKRLSYDKTVTRNLEEHWDHGEEKVSSANKQKTFMKTVLENINFDNHKKKSVKQLGASLLANDSLPKAELVSPKANDDNSENNEDRQERSMGPMSYEGEMKKRGRRTGTIMGNHGHWISRYYVLRGSVLYEFRDKKAFEAVLKENNGVLDLEHTKNVKCIQLSGYEILVDVRHEKPCLILSPMDENSELISRYYRVDNDTFREWARHLVTASLTSHQDDEDGF